MRFEFDPHFFVVEHKHAPRVKVQLGHTWHFHNLECGQQLCQDNLHLSHGKPHPNANSGASPKRVVSDLVMGNAAIQKPLGHKVLSILAIKFLQVMSKILIYHNKNFPV